MANVFEDYEKLAEENRFLRESVEHLRSLMATSHEVRMKAIEFTNQNFDELKTSRNDARHLVRRLVNRYVSNLPEPGVTNDVLEALKLWDAE